MTRLQKIRCNVMATFSVLSCAYVMGFLVNAPTNVTAQPIVRTPKLVADNAPSTVNGETLAIAKKMSNALPYAAHSLKAFRSVRSSGSATGQTNVMPAK